MASSVTGVSAIPVFFLTNNVKEVFKYSHNSYS